MVKSKENLFGAYAFLIGVILAILVGILQTTLDIKTSSLPYIILVLLGIGVGLSNFNERDSSTFLMASLSLVIVSGFGQTALFYISQVPILSSLSNILSALLVMFVPATIIVALKTVFSIATIQ
ncbi:MAG: hypothetical protein QW273_03080 [Candidatus Pacearchaeota archaeon]